MKHTQANLLIAPTLGAALVAALLGPAEVRAEASPEEPASAGQRTTRVGVMVGGNLATLTMRATAMSPIASSL